MAELDAQQKLRNEIQEGLTVGEDASVSEKREENEENTKENLQGIWNDIYFDVHYIFKHFGNRLDLPTSSHLEFGIELKKEEHDPTNQSKVINNIWKKLLKIDAEECEVTESQKQDNIVVQKLLDFTKNNMTPDPFDGMTVVNLVHLPLVIKLSIMKELAVFLFPEIDRNSFYEWQNSEQYEIVCLDLRLFKRLPGIKKRRLNRYNRRPWSYLYRREMSRRIYELIAWDPTSWLDFIENIKDAEAKQQLKKIYSEECKVHFDNMAANEDQVPCSSQGMKRKSSEDDVDETMEPIVKKPTPPNLPEKKPETFLDELAQIALENTLNGQRHLVVHVLDSTCEILCSRWLYFFDVKEVPPTIKNCMEFISSKNKLDINQKAWDDFQTKVIELAKCCASLQSEDENASRTRVFAMYLLRAIQLIYPTMPNFANNEETFLKRLDALLNEVYQKLADYHSAIVFDYSMIQKQASYAVSPKMAALPEEKKRRQIVLNFVESYRQIMKMWKKFYNFKEIPRLMMHAGSLIEDMSKKGYKMSTRKWKALLMWVYQKAMEILEANEVANPILTEEKYLSLVLLNFHKSMYNSFYDETIPDFEKGMLRKTVIGIGELMASLHKSTRKVEPFIIDLEPE